MRRLSVLAALALPWRTLPEALLIAGIVAIVIARATKSPARIPNHVTQNPTSGGSSRFSGERSAVLPATDSKIRHRCF